MGNMRRYGTRLYADEDHIPACFSRSWESDDDDCEGCQLEERCRNETINRASNHYMPSNSRKVETRNDQSESTSTSGISKPTSTGKDVIQFSDGVMLLPTEEEGWVPTLGKNVAAGSLAAIGKEVYRFFSRFRFR